MYVMDGFTCTLVSIDSLKIALYASLCKNGKKRVYEKKEYLLALSCSF